MNQKKLTYFFILVLMFSAGTAFSKSVSEFYPSRVSGKAPLKIAERTIIGLSAMCQSDSITDSIQNLGNNQPALSEKLSNYLIKNYILSNISLPFAENTRRTSIWFTSRLKN